VNTLNGWIKKRAKGMKRREESTIKSPGAPSLGARKKGKVKTRR